MDIETIFWCDNCDVAAMGIDELFDDGRGPDWPVISWCLVCGTIRMSGAKQPPIMTAGVAPHSEALAIYHQRLSLLLRDFRKRMGYKSVDDRLTPPDERGEDWIPF